MAILGNESHSADEDEQIAATTASDTDNPLATKIGESKTNQSLRVMSPNDINHISNKKRSSDADHDSGKLKAFLIILSELTYKPLLQVRS